MIENALITVFGIDADENTFIRYSGKASMRQLIKSAPDGKGFVYHNTYRVRISGSTDCGFKTGDFVCKGIWGKPPGRDKRLKVTAVCDNRIGAIPHWRLDCV